jgi:tRNA (cytidine/uridine-2'-O-)-methyltransferase
MNDMSIILVRPEIPQNTGNVIRLCANVGADLGLVGPLGYDLSDKKLKRAHLYYDEMASVNVYDNLDNCLSNYGDRRVFAVETWGSDNFYSVDFSPGDVLVFGSESSGLGQDIISNVDKVLYLPMSDGSRSMNLSNCVSVCLFEVWRQLGFKGANHRVSGMSFANGMVV